MIRHICSLLPEYLMFSILSLAPEVQEQICEIRFRKNAPMSISTYRKNLFIDRHKGLTADISNALRCSEQDLNFIVNKLCEGSVYRYMSTINSGYIVTSLGLRAGVCGECVYDSGKITAISKIECINMRIPKDIDSMGDIVSRHLLKNPTSSVLLCSPPGYGKTTAVRSVAKALGNGKFGVARRVAVIDERGEILPQGTEGLIDRFLGYKKIDGIEIATRLFSPELIVCDEIGQNDDTEAMMSVQNSGVPLLATAHGKSVESVMRRPNIKKLVECGIFDTFAVIEKNEGVSRIVLQKGNS